MPRDERSSTVANALEAGNGSAPGWALEILARIGQVEEGQRKGERPPRIPWEACHPVWQTGAIPLTAGAGQLIQSNLYGPELPYWWDLRTVSVFGFTAGTVNVFFNSLNGEPAGTATTPGQFTWSSQELMAPQDTLVFNATGVTGVVNLTVRAIEIETAWLPEYLM